MKNAAWIGLVFTGSLIIGACGKSEDTPPPATPATQYPPGQYPPQQYPQGQYPQQQQYPQGQYPQQAAPAPTAAAPVPAATGGGTMATPGALALPCQNDAACGFAKCNVQYQKCAFPCQGPVDCAAGNSCNAATGLCLPGGG